MPKGLKGPLSKAKLTSGAGDGGRNTDPQVRYDWKTFGS